MSNYLRWYRPEATYFFTVNTNRHHPLFVTDAARSLLRESIAFVRNELPFELVAMVLLPDHIHAIWTMTHDCDYSKRWGRIKRHFTQQWRARSLPERSISMARQRRYEAGIWQRRFWEHLIRDRDDMANHMDYVHYNPRKHGLVRCPHAWPYSSFHKWVEKGAYQRNWLCQCDQTHPSVPDHVRDLSTSGE